MARHLFQPGNKLGRGRPPGAVNKLSAEVREFWTQFFASAEYRESARRRIIAGRAPHLEGYWLPAIYGKPAETVTLQGDARKPVRLVVVRNGVSAVRAVRED